MFAIIMGNSFFNDLIEEVNLLAASPNLIQTGFEGSREFSPYGKSWQSDET